MTTASVTRPTPATWRVVALRFWRTFTSIRIAVIEMGILVAVSLLGTFIIQAPQFIQDVPAFYDEWLQVVATPRFGAATEVMYRLGLFNIFQATWFRLLLLFVAVHIIICTLNRWPAIRKALFEPQVRRNDAFYERSSNLVQLDAPAGAAGLVTVLRRHRYRVVELQEGPATFVYGDRNGWAKLATFASHIGLLLILGGAMFSNATSFERDLIIPDGQTQPLYPVSHPEQIQVLNKGFGLDYYPDGRPSDFFSDIVLYQGGREVAEKRIRVNDPLDYAGFVFYQATFGKAVNLQVTDAQGGVLFSENASLLDTLGDITYREVVLPSAGLSLVVALVPEEGSVTTPGSTVPQPAGQDASKLRNRLAILGFKPSNPAGPVFNISVPPGGSQTIEGITITNRGEGFFTGLRVRKDPGLNMILIGSMLFIAFTTITFWFQRRRVWARVVGNRIDMGGNADRFIDIKREIGEVAEKVSPPAPG